MQSWGRCGMAGARRCFCSCAPRPPPLLFMLDSGLFYLSVFHKHHSGSRPGTHRWGNDSPTVLVLGPWFPFPSQRAPAGTHLTLWGVAWGQGPFDPCGSSRSPLPAGSPTSPETLAVPINLSPKPLLLRALCTCSLETHGLSSSGQS